MKFLLNIATLQAADGGPPQAVLQTAIRLRHLGHDVSVVALTQAGAVNLDLVEAARDCGVRVVLIKVKRLGKFRLSFRQLFQAIREARGATVVTTHGFYQFTALVGLIASLTSGAQLWLQPHGVFEPYQESTSRFRKNLYWLGFGAVLRRRVDRIIAASRSELHGISIRFPTTVAHVIPLGTNVGPIGRVERTPGSASTVLFMSRIAEKKRLDLLIAASHILAARGVAAKLIICGEGDPKLVEELRRLASDLSVEWWGQADGARRRTAYALSDIFVLPSENENFGQAVTDAMAAGLPIVTTPFVGAAEHVVAAGAGYIVECLDSEYLANCLERLINDPDGRQVMSTNALEYTRSILSWDRFSNAWAELARQAPTESMGS